MQISPAQAIAARGLQKQWVAAQMGISPSYLTLLLKGSRRWTPDLAGKFPLVVGLASDAICFAANCAADARLLGSTRTMAAEALDSRQDARDGASEYSATCTATTSR